MAGARAPFRRRGVAKTPEAVPDPGDDWRPRYVVVGTPNLSGKIRADADLGVAHGTRSEVRAYGYYGDRSEGRNTVRYCTTPGTTSYGWIIDFDGTVYELGGYHGAAWHAGYLNDDSRGVAFAQANDGDPLTHAQIRSFRWLAQDINKMGLVPLVRTLDENRPGWIEHREAAQGKASRKSDVGTISWSEVLS